jgi:glycosyltransferase involved in cell wall biosynthesis
VKVAIILPAYNEELTIVEVIERFHAAAPSAEIYVVDNNSADRTQQLARETMQRLGAPGQVLFEPRQGKGMAVRTAFLKVDADIYVMVDADLTYHASDLATLMQPVVDGRVDMVVGDRHSTGDYQKENKRAYHGFGNNLVRRLINAAFGANLHDILSGYRIFSRRFVRTFPILYPGFQLETELALHSLDKRMAMMELPITYSDRPEGSSSKLNTFRDGFRVLLTIFNVFRYYKPVFFFGMLSLLFFFAALAVGAPVLREYILYRYVYAIPSAILATGMMILSIVLFALALLLDASAHQHRFQFELSLHQIGDGPTDRAVNEKTSAANDAAVSDRSATYA